MKKNFPLVLLSVLMMCVGFISCKKTYVCKCYTHPSRSLMAKPPAYYDLQAYKRSDANFTCKARSSKNLYTHWQTDCALEN